MTRVKNRAKNVYTRLKHRKEKALGQNRSTSSERCGSLPNTWYHKLARSFTKAESGGCNSIICHLLSIFPRRVSVSELLNNEGRSRDESTTNSHRFAPTVAFAALCDQSAWCIHGREGRRRLQYRMYGTGMRHYDHVFDVIWSVYGVIRAAFSVRGRMLS